MRKPVVVALAALAGAALAPFGRSAPPPPGCPQLLPLAANSIGPSVEAALRLFKPGDRPLVTGADIASRDTQRGDEARRRCGSHVASRTVIVYVSERSLLPSASLSERVFFVGRVKSGYRVWEIER